MVTIAHLVKKAVQDNDSLLESMGKDIINYANLAALLKPQIEKEFGKEVKESAIMMALRRFAEEIGSHDTQLKKLPGEILMRTNIMDVNVVKSPSFSSKIKDLYKIVDVEHGDVFNVILGNNEASIITSDKYAQKLENFLKGEHVISRQKDLVAITVRFSSKEFLTTPGIISSAVRRLAWESINIFEIVSTMTEFTVIVHKKDSMRAYTALSDVVAV